MMRRKFIALCLRIWLLFFLCRVWVAGSKELHNSSQNMEKQEIQCRSKSKDNFERGSLHWIGNLLSNGKDPTKAWIGDTQENGQKLGTPRKESYNIIIQLK